MNTPFDAAITEIARAGYHNHRLETHSDLVSDGIVADLQRACEVFRRDVEVGVVQIWKNVASPGDRERRVDLFVGEPNAKGEPDIAKVRIAIENKSVITAHRNRTNRFDDLSKVLAAVQGARPEALLIATVLVGLADRVLNIPDHVHKFFRDRDEEFTRNVRRASQRATNHFSTNFRGPSARTDPKTPPKPSSFSGPSRPAGRRRPT